MNEQNMGSSIDDFLREEGIFEEAQAQAIKEVLAWRLAGRAPLKASTEILMNKRRKSKQIAPVFRSIE
jgi:hypothetical protein